jgi:hypothetical protein
VGTDHHRRRGRCNSRQQRALARGDQLRLDAGRRRANAGLTIGFCVACRAVREGVEPADARYGIDVSVKDRMLVVRDSGIGMSKDDLSSNKNDLYQNGVGCFCVNASNKMTF